MRAVIKSRSIINRTQGAKGDRKHSICILDRTGEVVSRNTVSNTAMALHKCFKNQKPAWFAIEAGTHSAGVSRVLEKMGHEVLVGNPRKLRAIWSSKEKYPETATLQAVVGVGPITALAYVLTLEDPKRFRKSRDVGPFLGRVPKRDQSGDTDKQLSITKAGNFALRRLLVGCAQYILGAFGPECELREFGLKLAERGGKNAKKRAVVAVARKLAVMLHRLWVDEARYDPFHQQSRKPLSHAA